MSNNRVILEGCIAQYKSDNQLEMSDSEVFELFSLTQITKNTDISFENLQNSIIDGSQDGGIDSVITIVNDEVMNSVEDVFEDDISNRTITKFIITQGKRENSFKETVLDKLVTSCSYIFDLENDDASLLARFNLDLVEKIMIVRKAWLITSIKGGKISVQFNYCCIAPTAVYNRAYESKIEQLIKLTKTEFSGSSIQFDNYSCEELLKLYQTRISTRLTLTFKEQPLSTSYGEHGIGYVGPIRIGDYKRFLEDEEGNIQEHLFESNIRHFQGMVDVNKKIMNTIKTDTTNDFWWLNNGITMIAENPNLVGRALSVDKVQIVNGLQTSYSIFNNHDGNTQDERSVLVKVVIMQDEEAIDKIISSTNSQNQISAALLRATDDTQRKIELFFLNEGYYYDRRKSYYKNVGKPASKIFSIQFAAQAIETIGFSSPYSARAKPTTLVKERTAYERIFDPQRDFKSYLNCCLVSRKTHEYWVNCEDQGKKSGSSNFKLNLVRISASFILGKANYSFEDLAHLDITQYTMEIFDKSMSLLHYMLGKYMKTRPDTNLINVAKSKPFSDEILAELEHVFA